MSELTGGVVSGPNATKALAEWCRDNGVEVPNLQKDTSRGCSRACQTAT
jgi:hypothetical protein